MIEAGVDIDKIVRVSGFSRARILRSELNLEG
jgi:hypothetical protein